MMKYRFCELFLIAVFCLIIFTGIGSASINVIQNGDFSDVSGGTAIGWAQQSTVSGTYKYASLTPTSSSMEVQIKAANYQSVDIALSQYVSSLNAVDTISFKSKVTEKGSMTRYRNAVSLYIDGSFVDSFELSELGWSGSYVTCTATIPSQYQTSDQHQIMFTFYTTDTSGASSLNQGDSFKITITDVQALQKTTPPSVSQVVLDSNMVGNIPVNFQFIPGDLPSSGTATIEVIIMYYYDDHWVTVETDSIPITASVSSPKQVSYLFANQGSYRISASGKLVVGGITYTQSSATTITVTIISQNPSGNVYISTDGVSVAQSAYIGQTVYLIPSISWNGVSESSRKMKIYMDGITLTQEYTGSSIPAYFSYTSGYQTAGTYTAKIVVSNENGNEITIQAGAISISNQPAPIINSLSITSGSITGSAPFNIVFLPQVNWNDGVPSKIHWTFTNINTTVSSQETQTTDLSGGYLHTFTEAGNYTVAAKAESTVGLQSSLYTLSTTIVISSPSVTPTPIIGSGSGSMYASTFVTIYVLSDPYGTPLPGISVSAVGWTASAASWLGDLFGQTWGDRIQGSAVMDTTDFEGKVTFPMFPSVKYTVNITDTQNRMQSQPYTYSFTPSTLTTPYQIYIKVKDVSDRYSANDVITSVMIDNTNGQFTASLQDKSMTIYNATFATYLKNSEGEWNYQQYLSDSIGSNYLWSTNKTISGFTGNEYKFVFSGDSDAFGHFERTFYKTFTGPRLNIGIPNSLYIWICFLTALLLGGVATYLSSPATCFLICFVEWIYWFFGWFFTIDDMIPGISFGLLIMATILSIAYYISSRK